MTDNAQIMRFHVWYSPCYALRFRHRRDGNDAGRIFIRPGARARCFRSSVLSGLRRPNSQSIAEEGIAEDYWKVRIQYNYYWVYDPAVGRYVQSDPIGLGGGLNTYANVGSSSLLYFDPLGLLR